jgi:ubiquinone/menaquinone biosynthesis C-methylase UbiE
MTSSTSTQSPQPDPGAIFDMMLSFQRSAALKAAVELQIFTHIGRGANTAESLAQAAGASLRGVRILCDYLVVGGILEKSGTEYSLPLNTSIFLNRDSPAYLGGMAAFLIGPEMVKSFADLTTTVRQGTTTLPNQGNVTPENPIWIDFANSMTAMMRPASEEIAEAVAGEGVRQVLDIAAGHGLFGIAIAQRNPNARVTAVDWADVLAVAKANAGRAGVGDRYTPLPGDAFTVEYGGPYDVVLLTNFLHHFDVPTCETLLRKVRAALKPGGKCVTLEFVPNEDRVSPPQAASFSLVMLGTTPAGDAYTFAEFDSMFRNAGFSKNETLQLAGSPQTVIIST